ncbi:MAG: Flp pilus assembly CpaB [Herminiimonas sp.]|nr:Flp pilus assembly CpaB [Herminiimonas sp.]
MRNTRALTMMIIAVILAFGAVIMAARWISAQTQGSSNKIAVAMVDIGLGSRLNPEMVHMVDWPLGAMPPGAFMDAKLLEARVARTGMQRGEPIMEGKLAPPGTKGGLSAVVGEGNRAITVRVNDVVGVAGFALPGNFVDILVNTQGEGPKSSVNKDQSISKIVLERILVLAVAQESGRDETKPKVVNAVTLEVTPDQAEKLDLARSVGTLSLVLRNQIDPKSVTTTGATKTTLLNVKTMAEPDARPARPKLVTKRVAAISRPPGDLVEVIKGLDRSTQEF